MIKDIINYFTLSYLEKQKLKEQEVMKFYFGEIIDWNIQTTMYQALVSLISNMPEEYLDDIDFISNSVGGTKDIDAQLKCAIQTVVEDRKRSRKTKDAK